MGRRAVVRGVAAVRMPRSVPLLLMSVAVAVGLLTMHTLGHDQPSPARAMGSALAAHTGMAHVGDLEAMPGLQVGLAAEPHGGHGMPDGVAALCLAVLAATVIIVGLILSGRARGLAVPVVGVLRGGAAPGRGPPPLRLGLRLADLSVLRN